MLSSSMDQFEMRLVENGFELRGGKLAEPMVFSGEKEPDRVIIHLVGFLSRKDGSTLRIFDADGNLVTERVFDGADPDAKGIGGLGGPG
jgi:hypothetical protein